MQSKEQMSSNILTKYKKIDNLGNNALIETEENSLGTSQVFTSFKPHT